MASWIRYLSRVTDGFWLTVMSMPTFGSRVLLVVKLKTVPPVRYCASLVLDDVQELDPDWRYSA
jgi:hypothetical protein